MVSGDEIVVIGIIIVFTVKPIDYVELFQYDYRYLQVKRRKIKRNKC